MSFLKKLFIKTPDDHEKKGDKYFENYNFGLAKLEYEKGIEKLKPAELSGGMRKRVGLARALISNPDFILYDEPTTGLDPISSDVIDELIKNLKDNLNVTSIIVTHDMFTVKTVVDHVVMMNEGKIYFNGTPKELQSSNDKVIIDFIKRTE